MLFSRSAFSKLPLSILYLFRIGVIVVAYLISGLVAEWLACWTQAQKGLLSNCSRDAVG